MLTVFVSNGAGQTFYLYRPSLYEVASVLSVSARSRQTANGKQQTVSYSVGLGGMNWLLSPAVRPTGRGAGGCRDEYYFPPIDRSLSDAYFGLWS